MDTKKLEKIRTLLENWSEIWELGHKGDYMRGAEAPELRLPEMARHPSVRELDRCLRQLSRYAPKTYMHLKAFWVSAPTKIEHQWQQRKLASGHKEWIQQPVVVRKVPSWVNEEHVRAGERFLAVLFRGEVYIPKPLLGPGVPSGGDATLSKV